MTDGSGARMPVGNVTIPANHAVPNPGDLVEVRYMHMFDGGSLYQPVYKGVRTDIEVSAATISQVRRIKNKDAILDADDDSSTEMRAVRKMAA
jgi:bifunctional non-homologous end joining protein LigD